MAQANNREATLRITRPLRRDVKDLQTRVKQLEKLVAKLLRK